MNRIEILIIDDEEQITKLLEITLRANGYHIEKARNAKDGLRLAENHPPDVIILDLGLPDKAGMEVLQDLRQWYTNPIIILSVHNSEDIIIRALDLGANDYLVKPWRTGELLARIRSALRSSSQDEHEPVIQTDKLTIDLHLRTIRKHGDQIKLTTTEFSLLALFAKNDGKVLTHQFLLRAIWGPGFIHQLQYLRVFVAQIRKKIEEDPNRPVYLLTESGVGYRFMSGTAE